MDSKKYKDLVEKRAQYEEKLRKAYVGFRGVRHEDSASEIRYTQIKVYESFIHSIDEELASMKRPYLDKKNKLK